jgi:hypothetical protein
MYRDLPEFLEFRGPPTQVAIGQSPTLRSNRGDDSRAALDAAVASSRKFQAFSLKFMFESEDSSAALISLVIPGDRLGFGSKLKRR